jgi:hypothetical protein
VGRSQDKEERTARPPLTSSETGESSDKVFRLSDLSDTDHRVADPSPDLVLRRISLSFTVSLFPFLDLSLSQSLNPTSGFAELGLVGRGVWVSDSVGSSPMVRVGGRDHGWPGCWATVPDLAVFGRSTFRRRFGDGLQQNPAAGGAEAVVVF